MATVVMGRLGTNGWYTSPVTVDFSATDPDNTPAQLTTQFNVNGGPTVTANMLTLSQNGIFDVNFHSMDPAGNVEVTKTLVVKIDQTPPVVTIFASPTTLWPPNHKFQTVTVMGTVTDATSGPASTIAFHVMDEYGQVQPSGVAMVNPNGTYSFHVMLQASRFGQDRDGRQYTIFVTARDLAGNSTTVSTMVVVPHDQGQHVGNGQGNTGSQGNSNHGNHGHGRGRGSMGIGPSFAVNSNGNGNGNGHGHGHGHAMVGPSFAVNSNGNGNSGGDPGNGNNHGHGNGHGGGHGHGHG